jgi:hypothetical protein
MRYDRLLHISCIVLSAYTYSLETKIRNVFNRAEKSFKKPSSGQM